MKKEYIIPCMSFVYSTPIGSLLGIKNEELEKLYAIAIYWFQKKKFQKAFGLFEKLINLDPYQEKYFIGAGICCQSLKRYDLSIVYFEYANDLKYNPDIMYNVGESLLILNEIDSAIQSFNHVIEYSSNESLKQLSKKKISLLRK